MNRSRLVAIASMAAAAVPLTLTACGGSEDSSTDRSALVDDLMVVVAGEGTPNTSVPPASGGVGAGSGSGRQASGR